MTETSLVLELQRYAQDDACRISELLRRAKVVVVKLSLTEARTWIEHEINGYKPPSEIPDYRTVPSELKLAHPRLGWVTLPWERANPIQEHFASQQIRHPISEIEEALSGSGPLCSNVTQKELDLLQGFGNAHLLEFSMARVYGKSSFAGILEAVRAKVLDVSLELEKGGVLGAGMTFNDKEKSAAAGVVFNVGSVATFVHGDHANPSQNTFNASQVAAQGPHATAARNTLIQDTERMGSTAKQGQWILEAMTLRQALALRLQNEEDAQQLARVGTIEDCIRHLDIRRLGGMLEMLSDATWGVVSELKLAWLLSQRHQV